MSRFEITKVIGGCARLRSRRLLVCLRLLTVFAFLCAACHPEATPSNASTSGPRTPPTIDESSEPDAGPGGARQRQERVERLPLREALAVIASECYMGEDYNLHILAAPYLKNDPVEVEFYRIIPPESEQEEFAEPPDWWMDWRDALNEVAIQVHADIWPLGEETLLLIPKLPVSMQFQGASTDMLLDLILRHSGGNIVGFEGDLGTLDVDFQETPFREVLAEVCAKKDVLMMREGRFIYRISTPEHERRIASRPLPPETMNALGLGRSHADRRDRVTLRGDNKKASEFLKEITKTTGIPVQIDDDIDEPISLDLAEIRWRDAIEVIAYETWGVVWDDGEGTVRIHDIPGCSMAFTTALHLVMDMIVKAGGGRLEIDGGVMGSSQINTRDAPWRDLLYSLSRKVPFHLRVKPDGTFVAEPF